MTKLSNRCLSITSKGERCLREKSESCEEQFCWQHCDEPTKNKETSKRTQEILAYLGGTSALISIAQFIVEIFGQNLFATLIKDAIKDVESSVNQDRELAIQMIIFLIMMLAVDNEEEITMHPDCPKRLLDIIENQKDLIESFRNNKSLNQQFNAS